MCTKSLGRESASKEREYQKQIHFLAQILNGILLIVHYLASFCFLGYTSVNYRCYKGLHISMCIRTKNGQSQCCRYCDCFANGEFCHNCNCTNCANNLEHEEERSRAIKSCLDRNPMAFHPKIGMVKFNSEYFFYTY